MVLREMYRRKLWEKENMAEEESETSQENVVVKLYDPSLDEEVAGETSNDEMTPEMVQDKTLDVAESNDVVESNTAELSTAESGAVESGVAGGVDEGVDEGVDVLDSEPSPEPDTTPTSPELPDEIPTEMSETSEMVSASETPSALNEFQPEWTSKPKEKETTLSSVFDNQESLPVPETFKVDDILDEMTNENPPIIPADLSLRLEEDGNPENRIKQTEKENEDDWQEPDEHEILTKIAKPDPSDSNELSFLQSNIPSNQAENPNAVHSDISPMAVELLGEDFNFNSFFEEKLKLKKIGEEPIIISEISPGIYQADGGFINVANKQVMLELLPKEQEVGSLYPDHLIQNAVIEQDSSETAKNFSFTEESLPMFIRKKNRK